MGVGRSRGALSASVTAGGAGAADSVGKGRDAIGAKPGYSTTIFAGFNPFNPICWAQLYTDVSLPLTIVPLLASVNRFSTGFAKFSPKAILFDLRSEELQLFAGVVSLQTSFIPLLLRLISLMTRFVPLKKRASEDRDSMMQSSGSNQTLGTPGQLRKPLKCLTQP